MGEYLNLQIVSLSLFLSLSLSRCIVNADLCVGWLQCESHDEVPVVSLSTILETGASGSEL